MRLVFGLVSTAVVMAAALALGEQKDTLKVGDKAPDFKLRGSDGEQYALKQFLGKKAVAIAWFPKAFTGG